MIPRASVAAVALLGMLIPGGVRAASAPRWVRDAVPASPPAVSEECPALVLLDRTEVRLERDLEVEVHRRRVVRVRNSDGLPYSILQLHFEPGARLSDFYAWTLDQDGVRASADRSQLMESTLSPDGYMDVRLVSLAAPGARAGDLVAFEATWTERLPFPLVDWLPQGENLPVLRAELEIDLPKGWSAMIHGYRLAQPVPAGPLDHVSLALTGLPQLPDEPLRPEDSALLPRVVVRLAPAQGGAAFGRWETLAGWFADLARAAVAPAACPAELSASAGAGTPAQRVAELARAVQQKVRYVAIELGMQRWAPDPADATWQRRYGDCKDKAAVLVSALAANGIEARLTLVCTRHRWEVDPDSPDPFQFNHCIVAIAWPDGNPPGAATVQSRSGRRWTFFDPTDTNTPLGSISAQLGGTWGVIGDSAEGLVRLPEVTLSTVTREVRGRLADNGDLQGRITLWAEGPASAALLSAYGPLVPEERRNRAREWLSPRWPQAVLDSCWLAAMSRPERVGVEMGFRLPGLARPMGREWLVVPSLLSAWPTSPPRDTVRTTPVVLGDPAVTEERWDIELPAGLEPEQRPPARWRGAIADYSLTAGGTPGRLVLQRRLELHRHEALPGEYGEARAFWRAVYSGDRPTILLDRR